MKGIITIRGERNLWLEFIYKVKKEKKIAWGILSPFLKKYVSADDETRVLLILLPNDLVKQVMTEEDPNGFIEQAIRKSLDDRKSIH